MEQRKIEEKDHKEKRLPIKRILAVVLALLLLIGIGLHAPIQEYLESVQDVSQKVAEYGWGGHLIFLLGVTVLVLCGMPRLIFCVIGGMTFGWWIGLIYSVSATLLAYYLQFIFVRWGGKSFAERYLKRFHRIGHFIRQEGLSTVMLLRQVPLPGVAINFAFGLSTVRKRDYLLGTLIGQIPEALPCALVGAGLLENSGLKMTVMLLSALIAFILLWGGFKLFLYYQQKKITEI